ncbi:MAG: winged helix-turn-helix transcriptional regulator [Gammaproteobacteria bacterium]|nr:winged helix-turn-helix transcriptional regulator [Gammaproteobacteria bacterium]
MNTKPDREEQLVLELLDAVGRKSNVTQRHLAHQMGVALGLANSYLRRCIRKGFIKITEAPSNRYLYYLTPTGFSEKSRLAAKYLAHSFEFYRKAGDSCLRLYAECRARDLRRVVLCGHSDLAEIAALRAQEMNIEVVGVYDPEAEVRRLAGRPIWQSFAELPMFDVCMLTDLRAPLVVFEQLCAIVGREKILVPDILRLS